MLHIYIYRFPMKILLLLFYMLTVRPHFQSTQNRGRHRGRLKKLRRRRKRARCSPQRRVV